MTMTDGITKVLLLTGYLGSGKTTLVNRILANTDGIRFAVIVNDLGEVNIDASLIEKGGVVGQKDDSLVALQNGCICCTLKMDLVEQIREIVSKGVFDYIVIEASGICEPAPIAQTICALPSLLPQLGEMRSLVALGYLIFFGSLAGYTSFVWLMRCQPANRVGTHAFVNPVIAVIMGWLVGGETLHANVVIATALVVASVVIMIWEKRK